MTRTLGIFAGAIAILAAVVLWRASAGEVPAARRETMAKSFRSDIRNLAIEWNPHDRRPQDERDAALFSFVHQTYETSAWIPHSLFEGNLARQVVAGDLATIVRDKVGLVL